MLFCVALVLLQVTLIIIIVLSIAIILLLIIIIVVRSINVILAAHGDIVCVAELLFIAVIVEAAAVVGVVPHGLSEHGTVVLITRDVSLHE